MLSLDAWVIRGGRGMKDAVSRFSVSQLYPRRLRRETERDDGTYRSIDDYITPGPHRAAKGRKLLRSSA